MQKQKIKSVILCILFTVLTLIMLYAVANTLRDRQTTLSCMYSEPNDSLDVIIVGSSHVNNGYIPNILWEQNNLSACNVYSWSQPMWTAYYYIKETLRTQKPSVIVLEMYGMEYGHSYIMPEEIDKTNYANSFNIDIGPNFLGLIKTSENVGIDLRNYEDFLNLPRFHTRWKMFGPEIFSYNAHKDKDVLNGYGIEYGCTSFENPNIETDAVFEPYEFSVEYLDKITKLCKDKEITLIFSMLPYVYNETEAGINNWISQYAENNGIEFLNYNGVDGKRIGIDYSKDLSDNGHMNVYGAQKVTNDLSETLKKYITKQKSDSPYAEMHESDYQKYLRVLEANEIMSVNDVNDYISLALKDGKYSLFINNNGCELPQNVFDTLNMAQVSTPENRLKFMLVLNNDGENIVNATSVNFNLFNTNGTVSFNYADNDAEIYLNGREVMSQSSTFKIVLYDNILERPLETAVLENGQLIHREFTSDIISLYKVEKDK